MFPINPINEQLYTKNGITYEYSSITSIWSVSEKYTKPSTDSTDAFVYRKADGITDIFSIDTINKTLNIEGSTNNGTTKILIGKDSDDAEVFSVDTDGGIDGHLNSNHLSKDDTGFVDQDNIVINYNSIDRTMTLTHSSGVIKYLFQGKEYNLISPWISSSHIAGTVNYHLYSNDGINFQWSATYPELSVLFVATARYGVGLAEYFGIRECHGLMDWRTHQELHSQMGTYRVSGLDIEPSSVLINPTNANATNAGNRPIVNAGVINDEDLSTTIPQWLDTGVYSTLYFDVSGNPVINTSDMDIYVRVGNVLQCNPVGLGLQPVSNGNYVNLYCYHVPATLDTNSQKYRNVWLTGQTQYSTLANAIAEDPRSNNFQNITGQISEQIPYAVITMQYLSVISDANVLGKCKIASAVRYLSGNKTSLISGSSFAVSHNTTTGRDDVGNHTKVAPLTDSVSGFQITKADGVTTILNADTVNNSIGIGISTPNVKSILDLASITKGFLPPRMTSVQRLAILTPPEGLMVFQTDTEAGLYQFTLGVWKNLSSGAPSEWTAYTPIITGSTSNPTLATTKTLQALYRVVGKSLIISFDYFAQSATGATDGSGVYKVSLPVGYSIDQTKANVISTYSVTRGSYNGASASCLGSATVSNATSASVASSVIGTSDNNLALYTTISVTGSALHVCWSSGTFQISGAGATVKFTAEIPIL